MLTILFQKDLQLGIFGADSTLNHFRVAMSSIWSISSSLL